jgi:hypothetical protein
MHRLSILAALLVSLAVVSPAAANTAERFLFSEVTVDTASCGVVLTTHVSGDVTAHLANDGSWLFSQVKLRYSGVAEDPSTGRTIELPARQNVVDRGDVIAMNGQGIFIRLPGRGVLLLDVGHLVFDPSDGSTITASAHVIPFDDPAAVTKVDEAICSLFE